MSIPVTSYFQSRMFSTNPASLVFLVGFTGVASEDLSGYVMRWPDISRKAGDITGETMAFDVSNASQYFNSFNTDNSKFYQPVVFKFGFADGAGSYDTVQLFGGSLTKVVRKGAAASIVCQNKLAGLKRIKIGTDINPVSVASSNPADIVWSVLTSYSGLSSISSTSNPDIDYTSWSNWKQNLADDVYAMGAYFKDTELPKILETVQRVTDSVIYAEGDNKLYFNRWTGLVTSYHVITDSYTLPYPQYIVDTEALLNKIRVGVNYNPASNVWAGEFTYQNTASVGSFGAFEANYHDTTMWHISSATAYNLAQRVVYRRSNPNGAINIETPLAFINLQLGDTVQFTSRVLSLSNKTLIATAYQKRVGDGTMQITCEEGFGRSGGILNAFVLDDAVLGLLDQGYNPLF